LYEVVLGCAKTFFVWHCHPELSKGYVFTDSSVPQNDKERFRPLGYFTIVSRNYMICLVIVMTIIS
jgi:hypothetical protein